MTYIPAAFTRSKDLPKIGSNVRLYNQSIPSSHLNMRKADLVAPAGFNIDRIAQLVANQVATTIIHEAAHGKRWAQEYYTRQKDLTQMNRSEEEQYAEQAEQRAGLETKLTPDVFDNASTDEHTMSNQEILRRAIQIANRQNEFEIPEDAVEDVALGTSQWGQFQMTQRPDMPQPSMESTRHPHIAWNEENRKLQVDVDAIVSEYNRAIDSSNNRTNPSNHQSDGITAPYPGVSQKPPTDNAISAAPGVPSAPSVPSVEGR